MIQSIAFRSKLFLGFFSGLMYPVLLRPVLGLALTLEGMLILSDQKLVILMTPRWHMPDSRREGYEAQNQCCMIENSNGTYQIKNDPPGWKEGKQNKSQ